MRDIGKNPVLDTKTVQIPGRACFKPKDRFLFFGITYLSQKASNV